MARIQVPFSRVALFLGLVAAGCTADLATKGWIFNKLGIQSPRAPHQADPIVLVPGVLGLTTSLNEGALFGLGQRMTPVFATLSVVAAIGILYWLIVGGAACDGWLTIALGLIMGGIFGNLYDRLGLPGLVWPAFHERAGEPVFAVRDWIHFQIEAIGFDWYVFNLADSFLVIGACMLFWHVIWREPRQRAESIASTKLGSSRAA